MENNKPTVTLDKLLAAAEWFMRQSEDERGD